MMVIRKGPNCFWNALILCVVSFTNARASILDHPCVVLQRFSALSISFLFIYHYQRLEQEVWHSKKLDVEGRWEVHPRWEEEVQGPASKRDDKLQVSIQMTAQTFPRIQPGHGLAESSRRDAYREYLPKSDWMSMALDPVA